MPQQVSDTALHGVRPLSAAEITAISAGRRLYSAGVIGANATVVCGNEIGGYAFVGAGAVITQRVPDYALMVGIPARRIGWMSRAGERLGPTLVCSRDGSRYREKADGSLEHIDSEP